MIDGNNSSNDIVLMAKLNSNEPVTIHEITCTYARTPDYYHREIFKSRLIMVSYITFPLYLGINHYILLAGLINLISFYLNTMAPKEITVGILGI